MLESEFDLDAYAADESLFAQCPPEESAEESIGDLEPRPDDDDDERDGFINPRRVTVSGDAMVTGIDR